MRILWCSVTPYAPTGYGVQTRLNTEELAMLGHQVKILALGTKEHQADKIWIRDGRSIDIIPVQQTKQDILNVFRNLPSVVAAWHPDLVIFLGDAWLTDIRPFREVMAYRPAGPLLAVMSPVDCSPWSPRDRPLTKMADFALCMSKHAVEMIDHPRKHLIPHIVDTKCFDILHRQSDPDKFVVGMVQANVGTRKLVDIQLQGVALARRSIPDLVLYMHMDTWNHGGQGVDYSPLINTLGLSDVAITKSPLADPLTPAELAQLYNNFDVLLHITAGEGFGVPVAEAHACGVQAIVADNSASKEHPGALKVACSYKYWVPQLEAFHESPLPAGISRMLIRAHAASKLDSVIGRRTLRRKTEARCSRAVVREDHWKPFLERGPMNV